MALNPPPQSPSLLAQLLAPIEECIDDINLDKIQTIINKCGQSVKGDFKFTDEI